MTEEKISATLSKIKEPVLNLDFVKLDFVKNISLNGKNLLLTLGISDLDENMLNETREKIRAEFKNTIPEIKNVEIKFVTGVVEHKNSKKSLVMPGVKNTIAVASGKGGVGKSTVAVNLAVALALRSVKVGLIDADIYGPSIPLMFGLKGKPNVTKAGDKNKLVPMEKYGVKVMSIGFLMEEGNAVVWRGPMASSALKQFMGDVVWGELDYLLFDMPPGTGDIQLTLSQTIPLTGAIIVTTPQEISVADAKKGYYMFEKVNVPTLGIIENMSYYQSPEGTREHIFGEGGGRKMSEEFKVKLLGEIPINKDIRLGGDRGEPIVISHKNSPESLIFTRISQDLIREININNTAAANVSDLVIEI
ncbi:MAG: iron-sulfur cluster carrier protein ApbC [Bacteroidota bacterium]|nr:iron-sulfur cluster carrier protein ApbC [Bacteroidota bacterium]